MENENRFAISDLTGGQLNALVKKLIKAGGADIIRKVLSHDYNIIKVVIERVGFLFEMDYDLSLKSLVEADGWRTNCIDVKAKGFQTKQKGKKEVEAVLYGPFREEEVTPKEIIAEMEKDGYRPAELGELLVFAKKYPESVLKTEVFALGSVAMGEEMGKTRREGAGSLPYIGEYSKSLSSLGYCCNECFLRTYGLFLGIRK